MLNPLERPYDFDGDEALDPVELELFLEDLREERRRGNSYEETEYPDGDYLEDWEDLLAEDFDEEPEEDPFGNKDYD